MQLSRELTKKVFSMELGIQVLIHKAPAVLRGTQLLTELTKLCSLLELDVGQRNKMTARLEVFGCHNAILILSHSHTHSERILFFWEEQHVLNVTQTLCSFRKDTECSSSGSFRPL